MKLLLAGALALPLVFAQLPGASTRAPVAQDAPVQEAPAAKAPPDEAKAQDAEAQDAPVRVRPEIPPPHSALVPADRLAEAWWRERLEATNRRLAEGEVGMLFIGDSITQGWEVEGKAVWEEFYAARKAVNLGFGGDRTQHVLWRLERHGLSALAARGDGGRPPALAVVMIGTNNSPGDDNTAEEIADGIVAVVERLRAALPETQILLLAIFPRGERPGPLREKNQQASLAARRVADGERVHFLDIGRVFLAEDGTLPPEIMPDRLHLSERGYRLWAEAMEPRLEELLGSR